ncbi:MAG: hypothetical protein Q8M16_22640 [Pirellulaceae bacterium]|nr:hypothetical protein [Pirellulaceae bacterium]
MVTEPETSPVPRELLSNSPPRATSTQATAPQIRQLRIYSHSSLFYWWPVWVIGYLMALITYGFGQEHLIGQNRTWIHDSSNLGLLFFFVLFLVILITNVSVRGLASGMVILGIALVIVLLAYFGWWDHVLGWFGGLKISLNMGAYFWFSTLLLIVWLISVFVLDRTSYWEIKPGQLTFHALFGSGSQSYNTQGMALDKHRDDLFRHWLIGLGSGDLEIHTSGASRQQINVRNVLFIGSKVPVIQKLIAESPQGEEEAL